MVTSRIALTSAGDAVPSVLGRRGRARRGMRLRTAILYLLDDGPGISAVIVALGVTAGSRAGGQTNHRAYRPATVISDRAGSGPPAPNRCQRSR
jgi:hypothetical protein